ncbi:MAG: ATP-binding cassette domain-containing protein, partial [Pseudomonadota bacterium]
MIGSGNGCASHVLAIENLTKRFGALVATDDVSLAVADKTCHALIGPNGAGKTTLMQQISGTLKPDSGRIWFDGRDITTASVASRAAAGLGRTFQITAVVPTFSAHDNAALAAQAVRGTSFSFFRPAARETDTNAAARDALDHVGLADRADRLAGALSHGERRLLELAMVLAMKPKLL